ncbi:DUF397 domain-containing protein [Actinomadura rugatobispora]|uniref:DUF397 domain-containing protein n=1 Tax=Actinomadura rugatobispora TaxID=1994 RepID=A0ABW1AD89_9ACTN|nr:hypothetical protein GCM10010200_030680 [Actinomadura rugatobispora]
MTQWRKSSRSADTGQTDCVEVARLPLAVGIRDSKAPDAGHIALSHVTLASLLSGIKAGTFDL